MARLPRLTLADLPHHVIQRGNNRQPIFVDRSDRERLLALLADHATRLGVALHAYVLMDNHFHLLATPSTADGLPLLMQAIGRGYVRWYNDRHGRSGTLWEGRYRSTVIQPDPWLMVCMAYIDLNPVRSGVMPDAAAYQWSSHGHYAGVRHDRFLTPPAAYWQLGNTPFAREAGYADLVRAGVTPADQAALTEATLRGWALGDDAFLDSLQKATARRVVKARAGRPASAIPMP
jgi:putative transposase